jgi:hypothetical protein
MSSDFLIKIVVVALSIFVIIYIFSNLGSYSYMEGLENNQASTSGQNVDAKNGIAGNAAAYGSNIKAQTVKLQDTLLISKYRSEYENAIINLDDMVNNLMLQTALTIKQTNPVEGLDKLVKLHQSKAALNSVMKFIDST